MSTQKVKTVIFNMLTEGTGKTLCDSGDYYGRHWEKNQKKSLKDFEEEPSIQWEGDHYVISLFHYLVGNLEIDDICAAFNRKKVKNWESEIYGVSDKGEQFLKEYDFEIGESFNSYNYESSLSQVIQGNWIRLNDRQYLLLQIHNGYDVRGGYTDAKLFFVPNFDDGVFLEEVYGTVTKASGEVIQVDNCYNGYSLTDANGKSIEILETDKVELTLLKNMAKNVTRIK